jgi:hypothetical protein
MAGPLMNEEMKRMWRNYSIEKLLGIYWSD